MKIITKEINVSLHITGKTLGGSLNSIFTRKNNVQTGDQDHSLITTKMGARMITDANVVMVGKNKNIIQTTIS